MITRKGGKTLSRASQIMSNWEKSLDVRADVRAVRGFGGRFGGISAIGFLEIGSGGCSPGMIRFLLQESNRVTHGHDLAGLPAGACPGRDWAGGGTERAVCACPLPFRAPMEN